MDKRTLRSLLAIIDYMVPEEQRHWEEEGKPQDHIYNDVRRVRSWALRKVISDGANRVSNS